MSRLLGGMLQFVMGSIVLIMVAGCASYPPPDSRVPFWQYQRFNPENAPKEVKVALTQGDQYRELVFDNLCDPSAQGKANTYWYAEEGIKFYRHVLDELEPHNAYAAVCIGQLYIMRARQAPEKHKLVQLSSANNWLTEADEKRKGYADTHRFLGEMYAIKGEWYKAEAEFSKLVDSDFKDSHIYAWWGYVLKKQDKKAEANAFFRKAVEHGYPENCAAWARKQI